jgi:hypothetical protein
MTTVSHVSYFACLTKATTQAAVVITITLQQPEQQAVPGATHRSFLKNVLVMSHHPACQIMCSKEDFGTVCVIVLKVAGSEAKDAPVPPTSYAPDWSLQSGA